MYLENNAIVITGRGKGTGSVNCPFLRLFGHICVTLYNWRIFVQYWRSFDLYRRNIPRIFVPNF